MVVRFSKMTAGLLLGMLLTALTAFPVAAIVHPAETAAAPTSVSSKLLRLESRVLIRWRAKVYTPGGRFRLYVVSPSGNGWPITVQPAETSVSDYVFLDYNSYAGSNYRYELRYVNNHGKEEVLGVIVVSSLNPTPQGTLRAGAGSGNHAICQAGPPTPYEVNSRLERRTPDRIRSPRTKPEVPPPKLVA